MPISEIPHKKIRLYQTQEILSEQLELPLRLLRRDALERVLAIVSDEAKARLPQLCAQPIPQNPLDEDLPESIKKAFAPKKDELAVALSKAVWLTPLSAPNPLFDGLRSYFPSLKAYSYINYLRASLLSSTDESEQVLRWVPGFVEKIVPFSFGPPEAGRALLVVGPLWSSNPIQHKSQTVFLDLEAAINQLLVRLGELDTRPLATEHRQSLLALGSAFVILDDSFLISKIRLVLKTLAESQQLLSIYTSLSRNLASVEWARTVQWICFWRSRRFAPLLEMHILRPIIEKAISMKEVRQLKLSMGTALASNWKEVRRSIYIDVSIEMFPRPLIVSTSFRFGEELPGSPGMIHVESTVPDLELSPEDLREVQLSYLRFLEERRIARARQDYLVFDRLRHELQQLPFEETRRREEFIVRRARRLVMADYAALLRYNSLDDTLTLEAHRNPPWTATPRQGDLEFLQNLLAEIAKDLNLRTRSVLYRCLDSKRLQSRFLVSSDNPPFAVGVITEVEQIAGDERVWSYPAKDLLVIPIEFHGRVLGVLYLATAEALRFRYADRNRLVTFVHSFEAELFEARLLHTLQKMNYSLGRALRAGLNVQERQNFFNGLMRELGLLLAVRGATLWWRSSRKRQYLQLLGIAGQRLGGSISEGAELSRSAFPFTDSKREPVPVSLSASQSESLSALFSGDLKHVVLIPLWDLEHQELKGVISIHDLAPIALTPAFGHELAFMGQEIEQNIAEYMAARDRVEAIRDLIGHDVGTALRSIDSVRERLSLLLPSMRSDSREGFQRMLGDIEVHVDTARQLLDWLTGESVQTEVSFQMQNPIVAYYHFLNRNSLEKKTSVRQVVNEAFHPRLPDMNRKKITLEQRRPFLPRFWVRQNAVRQVFVNLIDNIVKYGIEGQKIILEDSGDEMEFFISLSSLGVPLREAIEADPQRVFERSVRGAVDRIANSTEGKGEGLYIASMLIRSWGGTIRLDYKHAQGARWAEYKFIISFPRWLAQEQNPWPL